MVNISWALTAYKIYKCSLKTVVLWPYMICFIQFVVTLKYSLSSVPHRYKTTICTCSQYQQVLDGLKAEYIYTCVSMYEWVCVREEVITSTSEEILNGSFEVVFWQISKKRSRYICFHCWNSLEVKSGLSRTLSIMATSPSLAWKKKGFSS